MVQAKRLMGSNPFHINHLTLRCGDIHHYWCKTTPHIWGLLHVMHQKQLKNGSIYEINI